MPQPFEGPDSDVQELRGPDRGIVRWVRPAGRLDLNGVATEGMAIARIPKHPRYEVHVFFEERHGNRVFTDLSVRAPDPAAQPADGITWEVLRAVSLPQIQREIDWAFRQWAHRPRIRDLAERFGQRPGRAGRDDAHYAQVAAEYLKHLKERAPIRATAQALAMSPGSVRDHVHEARNRGLLSPIKQGVAGGTLTERGLAALPRPRRKPNR